jgi:hypothetical protein
MAMTVRLQFCPGERLIQLNPTIFRFLRFFCFPRLCLFSHLAELKRCNVSETFDRTLNSLDDKTKTEKNECLRRESEDRDLKI